jgi:hypothetical protein
MQDFENQARIKDGHLHEFLEETFANVKSIINKYDILLTPIWENGHTDHDCIWLIGDFLRDEIEHLCFPIYSKSNSILPFQVQGINKKAIESKKIDLIKIKNNIYVMKKTIGIRVPDNNIAREIVTRLGNPIMNTSIYDDDDIIEYKADRMPIGIFDNLDQKFTNTEIDILGEQYIVHGRIAMERNEERITGIGSNANRIVMVAPLGRSELHLQFLVETRRKKALIRKKNQNLSIKIRQISRLYFFVLVNAKLHRLGRLNGQADPIGRFVKNADGLTMDLIQLEASEMDDRRLGYHCLRRSRRCMNCRRTLFYQ